MASSLHVFKRWLGVDNIAADKENPVGPQQLASQASPTSKTKLFEDVQRIDLGEFQTLRVLGRGGFGTVVLAEQRETSARYALKFGEQIDCCDMDEEQPFAALKVIQ